MAGMCHVSIWLVNVFTDGALREIETKLMNRNINMVFLEVSRALWLNLLHMIQHCTASEKMVQKTKNIMNGVCKKRKLKMNAMKSRIIISERREVTP